MDKVIAVIPTLGNDLERLTKAINSVRSFTTYQNFDLLIVDNSPDQQLSIGFPEENVVSHGINLGYVGSLEFVRRNFQFDYLWSIQDDMVLLNDVLSYLHSEFKGANESLAVTSPILIKNGKIPARTRGGIFTNSEEKDWENIPITDVDPKQFEIPPNLNFVSGSGALFNSKALNEVGGFNLNLYPLMHVDVDICLRFLRNGWKINLNKMAHIDHQIQGSTPSFLARSLDKINLNEIKKLTFGTESSQGVKAAELDYEFIYQIASKSTFLFLDLAKRANAEISKLENDNRKLNEENLERESRIQGLHFQNAELVSKIQEIKNSCSWQITGPLRLVKKLIFGTKYSK